MSYICTNCDNVVAASIPCNIVPSKIREKEYCLQNRIIYGWEIVKEERLCPDCSKIYVAPTISKRIDSSFKQFSWFHEFTNKKPRHSKHDKPTKTTKRNDTKKRRDNR